MDSLRDDGARKVLAGLTSVEEVLVATQEDVEIEPERPSMSSRLLS
jgi:general secretion pathway protein E